MTASEENTKDKIKNHVFDKTKYVDMTTRATDREKELETRLRELEMADLGNNITFKSMDIALSHIEAENIVLKKELEELRKANGWQPIETAPRDGTHIITGKATDHGVQFRRNHIYSGHFVHDFDDTHWMPLPTAPKKCGE